MISGMAAQGMSLRAIIRKIDRRATLLILSTRGI